jgi:acylphosphatase
LDELASLRSSVFDVTGWAVAAPSPPPPPQPQFPSAIQFPQRVPTNAASLRFASPRLPSGIFQLKIYAIDDTLVSLDQYGGFPNLIVTECRQIGLRGYVWRVPITHARILAAGSKEQIDRLLEYLNMLQGRHLFNSFIVEPPERPVVTNAFTVLPSTEKGVATGLDSKKELDEVVSDSSADTPGL